MNLHCSVLECIGNTPMVRLRRIPNPQGAEVVVKLESYNPGRSVKDRPALEMILAAEAEGKLQPGGTIIEATSGNMGVGLAIVGRARGYRVIAVMPELARPSLIALLQTLGAEVRLSPSIEGFAGALYLAQDLTEKTPGAFMPQQWANPNNVLAHKKTTGPEILRDTGGQLDAFVAGVGTGGTITGVGEVLKAYNPHIKIIAVEPKVSAVLSGGRPGWTYIYGLGAGFIPPILNRDLLDEIITVDDQEAYNMAKELARLEGISCGPSSGANVLAACQVAARMNPGQRVVTLIPDTGDRYMALWY